MPTIDELKNSWDAELRTHLYQADQAELWRVVDRCHAWYTALAHYGESMSPSHPWRADWATGAAQLLAGLIRARDLYPDEAGRFVFLSWGIVLAIVRQARSAEAGFRLDAAMVEKMAPKSYPTEVNDGYSGQGNAPEPIFGGVK